MYCLIYEFEKKNILKLDLYFLFVRNFFIIKKIMVSIVFFICYIFIFYEMLVGVVFL